MAKSSTLVAPPPPDELLKNKGFSDLGPKMQALTPRKRAFCWYYAHNGGNAAAAYRLAYPASESENAQRVEGSKLLAEPQVREALVDMANFQFDGLVIPAVGAMLQIVTNPGHKQHFKALEYVLDRRGFQPVQQSKVEHVHKIDSSNVDAALLNMAAALGINFAPKPQIAPPIDITPTEVEDDENW